MLLIAVYTRYIYDSDSMLKLMSSYHVRVDENACTSNTFVLIREQN